MVPLQCVSGLVQELVFPAPGITYFPRWGLKVSWLVRMKSRPSSKGMHSWWSSRTYTLTV